MRFFGGYVFDGVSWSDWDPDAGQQQSPREPWLSVLIHDSDVATIGYAPAGSGSGFAYLGTTPRVYFESESASQPTDIERESKTLVIWKSALDGEAAANVDELAARLVTYLASDDDAEPDADADIDDADVLVEIKTARFLAALGLVLPGDLRGQER
jgi:hypothetical protein